MPDQEPQKPQRLTLKLKTPGTPAQSPQPSDQPAAPQAQKELSTQTAPVTTSTQSLRATSTMKLKILSAETNTPVPPHSAPPPSQASSVQQTINLRPPSVGTSPSAPSPIPAARQTIRLIPKPAPSGAPPSGIQTTSPSQPTIKLGATPSASTSPSQQTIHLGGAQSQAPGSSQPTIKLSPSSVPPASQQTIKLHGDSQSPASKQTIRLSVKPPVAPAQNEAGARTIHIPSASSPAAAAPQTTPEAVTMVSPLAKEQEKISGKKKMSLRKDRSADSMPQDVSKLKAKAELAKAEPNGWFLASSIVAALIVFFMTFYFMAQYLNIYQGGELKAPFLHQALIK